MQWLLHGGRKPKSGPDSASPKIANGSHGPPMATFGWVRHGIRSPGKAGQILGRGRDRVWAGRLWSRMSLTPLRTGGQGEFLFKPCGATRIRRHARSALLFEWRPCARQPIRPILTRSDIHLSKSPAGIWFLEARHCPYQPAICFWVTRCVPQAIWAFDPGTVVPVDSSGLPVGQCQNAF